MLKGRAAENIKQGCLETHVPRYQRSVVKMVFKMCWHLILLIWVPVTLKCWFAWPLRSHTSPRHLGLNGIMASEIYATVSSAIHSEWKSRWALSGRVWWGLETSNHHSFLRSCVNTARPLLRNEFSWLEFGNMEVVLSLTWDFSSGRQPRGHDGVETHGEDQQDQQNQGKTSVTEQFPKSGVHQNQIPWFIGFLPLGFLQEQVNWRPWLTTSG